MQQQWQQRQQQQQKQQKSFEQKCKRQNANKVQTPHTEAAQAAAVDESHGVSEPQ